MDIVDEAHQLLQALRDISFPSRPYYLHPYTLLTALLQYAPVPEGKSEIANDILTQTQDDLVERLTKLTDYFFSNLLLPCNPLMTILSLTYIVRAQGGRTPTPSEHPSRRGESLDYRAAHGRLSQREKVSYISYFLILRPFGDANIVVLLVVNMIHLRLLGHGDFLRLLLKLRILFHITLDKLETILRYSFSFF